MGIAAAGDRRILFLRYLIVTTSTQRHTTDGSFAVFIHNS